MAIRAIVTGGAGFVGSHLVDLLLEKGHSVIAIDNLITGKITNIEHQKRNPNFQLIKADIADLKAILPVFSDVDWVFHLAALADIVASIEKPMDYHHSNVDGTVAVMEAARQSRIKRLIYAASSSCYGIPDVYPTPETATMRPMYPYAFTKYIGEEIVFHWRNVYKVPCLSLRLFNVYGPRARTTGAYGAVFGVFLAQKLAGQALTVVGNGEQTRDFIFVSDVAKAFLRAAESSVDGEVFNIGTGRPYSINYLVSLLGAQSTHIPRRPGEPDCTFADIRKVRAALNWEPYVTFEDGVQLMLEQIENWRDAPVWDKDSIAKATEEWFSHLRT